ncbi:MAG TPA: hypothetical protein DHU63_03870 [Candidatus Marinimicrobia bacterium]|nr:hypothetical protein [Candidatus Neomarinimicrobiota bacterium]
MPKDGIRSELLVLITDLPLSNSEIIVDKKNGSLIRLVDILIGISAILVFWPIVILVALAIKFDSKGPVFTKNSRLGKHLIEVELLSFRTTTLPSGLPMAIQTNSGRFLKYSSLDRLPWFFNLLKGDVSLIGPNPMRMTEIKELSENTIEMYSNIRPGIISGYMTEFFYQPNQLRYETKETLNDFRTAELQYHFAASYFDYLKVVWKAIFLVLTRSGEV